MGARASIARSALKHGTRVTLDMTTLTIMRILPREIDPTVRDVERRDQMFLTDWP